MLSPVNEKGAHLEGALDAGAWIANNVIQPFKLPASQIRYIKPPRIKNIAASHT